MDDDRYHEDEEVRGKPRYNMPKPVRSYDEIDSIIDDQPATFIAPVGEAREDSSWAIEHKPIADDAEWSRPRAASANPPAIPDIEAMPFPVASGRKAEVEEGTPKQVGWQRPEPGELAKKTCEELRRLLHDERGQKHSPQQWEALTDIVLCLGAMAEGKLDKDKIYLSSLDPGIGKTTAVCVFIRELLAFPAHGNASALVCVNRLDEIPRIAEEMRLAKGDFAVFTAEGNDINKLGLGIDKRRRARVLFTTQQMIDSKQKQGRMEEFNYGFGGKRDVKIWDESILPGRTLTLDIDAISQMLFPFSRTKLELRNDLESFVDEIRGVKDDKLWVVIHDLGSKHDVSVIDAWEILAGNGVTRDSVDTLWSMFGKPVNVHKTNTGRNYTISYEDQIYDQLKPMLVLDASGRVRDAYSVWGKSRGDLAFLKAGPKDYRNLTIHVCPKGAGKDSIKKHRAEISLGVANTLNELKEPTLVIGHKPFPDPKRKKEEIDILSDIQDQTHNKDVKYITWGMHRSTNDYKEFPNVILATSFLMPDGEYEAIHRLVKAAKIQEPANKEGIKGIRHGEIKHDILQALCRGKVRQSVDGGCPPCHAYIRCRQEIANLLVNIFPNAKIVLWNAGGTSKSGKDNIALALQFIDKLRSTGRQDKVWINDICKEIGLKRQNFNRDIGSKPSFQDALKSQGLAYYRTGGGRGGSYIGKA